MIIRNWGDIQDQFNYAAIILGNGASIALDDEINHPSRFDYPSLFQAARDDQFITDNVQEIFNQFQTQDFEFILLFAFKQII